MWIENIRKIVAENCPNHDPEMVAKFLRDLNMNFPDGTCKIPLDLDYDCILPWIKHCRENEPVEFSDWILEKQWHDIWIMESEEVVDVMKYITRGCPKLFKDLQDENVVNEICSNIVVKPELDYQFLYCNFLLATPNEQNLELDSIPAVFAKNSQNLDMKEIDSALFYVLDQLGLDIHDQNVQQELLDNVNYNACMTFCVQTDLDTLYQGFVNKAFTFEAGTRGGIFAPFSGAGGGMNMILDKPVVVPLDMVFSIQVEGRYGTYAPTGQYGLNEVYGMIGSFWKRTLKGGGNPPEFNKEKHVGNAALRM